MTAQIDDRVEKALTLWQPWATCVARWGKQVENRIWEPPAFIAGRRIAIHAASVPRPGKRAEREACEDVELDFEGIQLDLDTLPRGAVLATARVVGFVEVSKTALVWPAKIQRVRSCGRSEADVLAMCDTPWFVGPVGWALDDVRRFLTPIPCKGFQGLWNLPADVLAAMEGAPYDRPHVTEKFAPGRWRAVPPKGTADEA